MAGSISVISRLYDLRLTRHLIWVRKKAFKKLDKFLPEDFIDLRNIRLLENFWSTLIGKIVFIQEISASNYEQIRLRFNSLRKQSKLLGDLSWKAHKIQLAFIILSTILYGLTFIIMN